MDKLINSLPAILKASGESEEVTQAACIAAWKHAVGEGLSGHTAPIQLINKTLVVAVADDIWRRQLHQMRGQLLHRLNSVLGQPMVASIELRVDPKILAKLGGAFAEANKGKHLNLQVPAELLAAAAGIHDAELRSAFLGAATSCVRRLENPNSEI